MRTEDYEIKSIIENHALINACPDGVICDRNAVCKHIGGLRVSFLNVNTVQKNKINDVYDHSNMFEIYNINSTNVCAKLGLVEMDLYAG